MYPPPQFHSLLGGDSTEEYGGDAPYWYSQPHEHLSYIDPQLEEAFSSPCNDYMNVHQQRPVDTRRFYTTTYDPIAHGFSPRTVRVHGHGVLDQIGVLNPGHEDMVDLYRQLRHYSPTDPTGLTLSSTTESSYSDYALSPDIGRSPQDLVFAQTSQEFYSTPLSLPSSTGHIWTPQPTFIPTHSSAPVPVQHTVPSMAHLQVTPDPEQEDEPMEDKEALHHRINLPEELELSGHIVSPPDSGLGASIDEDDVVKDEEENEVDCGAHETDSDTEFLPGVRGTAPRRRSSSNPIKGRSLRPPRQKTSPGKPVIDPKARVRKPSQQQPQPPTTTSSRAKGKKRSLTNLEAGSKNFPCAFHHFGCPATFANKNEWKRHVSSQHLQLGYYRCDLGSCSVDVVQTQEKGFNDFNRKDLFTQHCRRMHAPWSGGKKAEERVSKRERDNFEKHLEVIRGRCWIEQRQAPQKTKCGFCGAQFIGGAGDSKGWEERMEHVGRHFDREQWNSADEKLDDGLKQWAVEEGVVREGKTKGEYWLVGYEPTQGSHGGTRGRRRSRRLGKEEVVEAASKEDNEDYDAVGKVQGSDDDEDTASEAKGLPELETRSDDEPEDGGDASDTDAEGEDE